MYDVLSENANFLSEIDFSPLFLPQAFSFMFGLLLCFRVRLFLRLNVVETDLISLLFVLPNFPI